MRTRALAQPEYQQRTAQLPPLRHNHHGRNARALGPHTHTRPVLLKHGRALLIAARAVSKQVLNLIVVDSKVVEYIEFGLVWFVIMRGRGVGLV